MLLLAPMTGFTRFRSPHENLMSPPKEQNVIGDLLHYSCAAGGVIIVLSHIAAAAL